MIEIVIPNFDLTVDRTEIKNIPKCGGVYIFYGKDDKPLYVGQSQNLKSRIYSHFIGNTNTSAYQRYLKKCSMFFEDDELNRLIYELYIMNNGVYPLNIAKKMGYIPKQFSLEVVYDDRCNHIKENGRRCGNKPHKNGFCHLHGGNGITKGNSVEYLLGV